MMMMISQVRLITLGVRLPELSTLDKMPRLQYRMPEIKFQGLEAPSFDTVTGVLAYHDPPSVSEK